MVSEQKEGQLPRHDSDSTLELPALDVEAYESSSVMADSASNVADGLDSTANQRAMVLDAERSDLADFEAEIVALSADVHKLRAELERRDAIIAERDATIAARDADLSQTRTQSDIAVAELRRDVAQGGTRAEDLQRQLASLQDQLDTARGENQSLRQQSIRQVEGLRHAEGRRGIWEALLRDGDAEIIESQNARTNAERESASSATRAAELEAELVSIRQKLASDGESLQAQLQQASERVASLESAQREAQSQSEALRTALEARTAQVDAATALATRLSSELDEARAGMAALMSEAQSAELVTRQLRDDVATQQSQHQDAMALTVRLQTELAETRERITWLGQQIRDSDARAQAAVALSQSLDSRSREVEERAVQRIESAELKAREAQARAHQLELELSVKSARLEALLTISKVQQPRAAAERAPVDQVDPESSIDMPARYLVLLDSPGESVFLLNRRTTVGRGEDNDIRLERSSVSRHHAVIMSGPKHTVIEDLQSTNGVVVNRRRTRRAVLRDGDVVYVGKCRFRYSEKPRHAS
jgi:chromosome segregation ATPase